MGKAHAAPPHQLVKTHSMAAAGPVRRRKPPTSTGEFSTAHFSGAPGFERIAFRALEITGMHPKMAAIRLRGDEW